MWVVTFKAVVVAVSGKAVVSRLSKLSGSPNLVSKWQLSSLKPFFVYSSVRGHGSHGKPLPCPKSAKLFKIYKIPALIISGFLYLWIISLGMLTWHQLSSEILKTRDWSRCQRNKLVELPKRQTRCMNKAYSHIILRLFFNSKLLKIISHCNLAFSLVAIQMNLNLYCVCSVNNGPLRLSSCCY